MPSAWRGPRRRARIEKDAPCGRLAARDDAALGQCRAGRLRAHRRGDRALRGFEAQEEPYFDRLYEQVNRLLASIDAAANGLAMLLDLQLNERAYVVSVVATIFVPLTLLTGFFGMNFGWMVDQIESPIAFWLLGFFGPIAVAAVCWRFLVRRFVTDD